MSKQETGSADTKEIQSIDSSMDNNNEYHPSVKEEYMCQRHLDYFRDKLQKWRSDLCKESMDTVTALQEEHLRGPEIGEMAALEAETTHALRTRDRYRKLIKKIDSAIDRIENGNYGYCDETGEPIGLKRLDARPIATLSIEAQEMHEKYEKSHKDD